MDSIISHSAKVGHIANPKGQGKAAESASSKRILPLKRMLTSRKPVEQVKGIIGKTTDLFTELRQMSEDAFTSDERAALPAIEQFTTELSEAVDRVAT